MKPLTSFRVYPTRTGRLYFIVNIWPTKKAMHKHCWWVKGNFEAACCGHEKFKNGKRLHEIGELDFNVRRLGAGLVTHEFMHVTMRHANIHKYKGLSFELKKSGMVSDAEEYLCDVIGRMVAQFWSNFYKWEDSNA